MMDQKYNVCDFIVKNTVLVINKSIEIKTKSWYEIVYLSKENETMYATIAKVLSVNGTQPEEIIFVDINTSQSKFVTMKLEQLLYLEFIQELPDVIFGIVSDSIEARIKKYNKKMNDKESELDTLKRVIRSDE